MLINKYVHAQALVSASGGKDMGGGGGGKNSNGLNGEALDDNGLVRRRPKAPHQPSLYHTPTLSLSPSPAPSPLGGRTRLLGGSPRP